MSQQVSVASAAAIHGRLVAIADPFDHAAVLRARKDKLLRVGLSNAKIKTLKEIAKAIEKQHIDLDALADHPADDAHALLTQLHGIGPWTADIYLLACLGHADAWPAGDLALQEAARVAFGLTRAAHHQGDGPARRPLAAVACGRGAAAVDLLSRREEPRRRATAGSAKACGEKEARQEWLNSTVRGSRRRAAPARQLVVFVHGYGADGNDLIEIGRAWQVFLPDAAFVSPHAPRPCGQAPMGREWFPLTFRDPDERWTGVNAAAPGFDQFLDAELARHQLPPSALALVGFSQGTMMSLHVGLRRAVPPAAIVGYSGMLVLEGDSDLDGYKPKVRARPPVLLVHGDQDDLIPIQALLHATQGLAALEVPVEWHISAGIGHGIDDEGLRQGGDFLARRFRAPRSPSMTA